MKLMRAVVFGTLSLVFVCAPANCLYAVTIDWVSIGNRGNESENEFGGVAYAYRIGKYEVTNAQYAEFLNAVAATDSNSLYNGDMESKIMGGIRRTGSNGSYCYTVKPGRDDYQVVYVSYFDAMRFVNWLENGQPNGI
ncbi:MAG: SUMF1/EgtB/PvdO family nonheme iron enzyme [Pirellulales bacterium]